MRRALLTGASGFVGSHLVRTLKRRGWEVAAIAREGAWRRLRDDGLVDRLFLYSGKTEEVNDAFRGFCPDVVFHCASLFLVEHKTGDIEQLIASNILLGVQVLEGMVRNEIKKIVNAGTSWQNSRGAEYSALNLYAATKQAFEDILAYYVASAQLKSVTLRLFDTYGAGDNRRKLVGALIESLRSGEILSMSAGDQPIDLVHIDDVCQAFTRAADMLFEQGMPGSSIYALGGNDRMPVKAVISTLEHELRCKFPVELGARPYRGPEIMELWQGPRLPGWEPKITLVEGFKGLLNEPKSV